MKLVNSDVVTFVQSFGVEGLQLIEDRNVEIYLLDEATAQQLCLGEVMALTAGNWNAKPGEASAIMFFNMTRIMGQMNILQRHVKGAVEKMFRAFLVHELVHVQQIEDGRMKQKNGKIIWEGKTYAIKNDGSNEYYNYPWEQEAHMAQFEYEMNGNTNAARAALNKLSNVA